MNNLTLTLNRKAAQSLFLTFFLSFVNLAGAFLAAVPRSVWRCPAGYVLGFEPPPPLEQPPYCAYDDPIVKPYPGRSDEIVYAATAEQADLIVMAKRHKGLLGRMLSPSVSERLSREAPCAVLSVCPPQVGLPQARRESTIFQGILEGS